MMEMFTYEMSQLVEQLEQNVIKGENGYSMGEINEIFRIMHTIKGSAAMMMFDTIANTAHSMEDLFFYLREKNPQGVDFSELTDRILEAMDFIKGELNKIESGLPSDGDSSDIVLKIKNFLKIIKGETAPVAKAVAKAPVVQAPKPVVSDGNRFRALIKFEEGCEMENIRSYTLVHNLGNSIRDFVHVPEDIIDEEAIPYIRANGFLIEFTTDETYEKMKSTLERTVYMRELTFDQVDAKSNRSSLYTHYRVFMTFSDGVEMENVRAYTVVHNIEDRVNEISHIPSDIIDESSIDVIRANGFTMEFKTTMSHDEIEDFFASSANLKNYVITNLDQDGEQEENEEAVVIEREPEIIDQPKADPTATQVVKKSAVQHVISVNVSKLDQLLNLMGELVIAEAMVTQNPELEGLELESFHKETRQLRKIITDVQDNVMSMRMVPLSQTFFKMHRIVRDMCKALDKDVTLEIIGEETEVDKNIIEHISDPLMHIIRNSVDHGIETPTARSKVGKSEKGTVFLEAKNSGGDVLIIVRDDGAGINKDAVMAKAKRNGLLRKPENEYTDKEIHQFIFLPGFSTNEAVTAFSGRGVGMDVVSTNLEIVGGSVIVDSTPGLGSVFTLKIPLTLAIIEGMTIKMGGAKYTIPIISIKQSFKAKKDSVFIDPSGNEMIQVRGDIFNVVRLYDFFQVDSAVSDVEEGIMIVLENGEQTICIFADELVGEQQVVVKSMPKYIKKIRGISGCTLLGNGDISLIIDVAGFFDK